MSTAPLTYNAPVFLDGYVDTSIPGYRKISIGGTVYTVANGFYVWADYITAINTAISGAGWTVTVSTTGQVQLAGSSAAVVFTDRLGWALGFNVEPGHDAGTITAIRSSFVSPVHIALMGATWEAVDLKRESVLEIDRAARGHGYVWGGARVWRCTLTMTRSDLEALRTGWAVSGKVRVNPVGASAVISKTNDSGWIEGWSMGIEGVDWIDSVESMARVRMLISDGDIS